MEEGPKNQSDIPFAEEFVFIKINNLGMLRREIN